MIWTMLRRFTRQAITQAPGGGKRGTPEPPSGGTHLPAAPAPAAGSLTDAERRHLAALAATRGGRELADDLRLLFQPGTGPSDTDLGRICLHVYRELGNTAEQLEPRNALAWSTDVAAAAAVHLTSAERKGIRL